MVTTFAFTACDAIKWLIKFCYTKMNWIYELSIRGSSDRSKKTQKAKDKLCEMIAKPEGKKAIFTEVAAGLKTSSDAQLGFLTIFVKHLLPKLIEAKALDSPVVDGLLKLALQLHANLLKQNSPKKMKYALKLFNKIVSKLAQSEREALAQSRLRLIPRS